MVSSNLDIMRHMFDTLDVFIRPKVIRKPLLGVLRIFQKFRRADKLKIRKKYVPT